MIYFYVPKEKKKIVEAFWLTELYILALRCQKLLEDMAARGVKYIDCYGVDNALVSSCF